VTLFLVEEMETMVDERMFFFGRMSVAGCPAGDAGGPAAALGPGRSVAAAGRLAAPVRAWLRMQIGLFVQLSVRAAVSDEISYDPGTCCMSYSILIDCVCDVRTSIRVPNSCDTS
jgi:hypothetical protein